MTETETLRMIRDKYGSILVSAAVHFGHRAEVLAGICMRESAGGTSPLLDIPGSGGRGDGGHGHGLMQIDDRSFPDFCRGDDWKDAGKNIDFGAMVLRQKRWFLITQIGASITHEEMERASIASYNAGEGNIVKSIKTGMGFDYFTAGKNYSSECLRFALMYLNL
jgi:hypothetical protein